MTTTDNAAMLAAMDAHDAQVLATGPLVKHEHQRLNCITHWYKALLSTAIPMPETAIIQPDVRLYEFANVLDGPLCPPETLAKFEQLVKDVEFQCAKKGYPAFLRTGTISGKHSWKDTCFIAGPDKVKRNLACLIEDAAMKDQCVDVFAVREFLPTEPVFHAFMGEMPIVRERRFFVRDGAVLEHIPYWPAEAFEHQYTSTEYWQEKVAAISVLAPEDETRLTEWACTASRHLPGDWSVDFLETKKGWYLTDCAVGRMSWGWKKEWDLC